MTNNQVERVVVLSDAEIEALTFDVRAAQQSTEIETGLADSTALGKLRKALEQPQGEVEYRVVGEGRLGTQPAACYGLDHARLRAKELAVGSTLFRPWKNIRIQSRTTHRTEWTDIDQEGEG